MILKILLYPSCQEKVFILYLIYFHIFHLMMLVHYILSLKNGKDRVL
jgi:hypothetical protein